MEATAYCSCYKCTDKHPGDSGYGITKSGVMAKPGIVAVDPKVIPLGTKLWIEGYGEAVAEDTGGGIKGNRIDIYMDRHEDAVEFGRKMVRVKVLSQ
jgi:3D (Asp-Asp-Asp) domain-containing protein